MKSTFNRLAYIEGSGSIALNTALFILKYWVGIATGSIAYSISVGNECVVDITPYALFASWSRKV